MFSFVLTQCSTELKTLVNPPGLAVSSMNTGTADPRRTTVCIIACSERGAIQRVRNPIFDRSLVRYRKKGYALVFGCFGKHITVFRSPKAVDHRNLYQTGFPMRNNTNSERVNEKKPMFSHTFVQSL